MAIYIDSTRVYRISTRSMFEYDNHRTCGLSIGSQVQGYSSIRFKLLFLFSLIFHLKEIWIESKSCSEKNP